MAEQERNRLEAFIEDEIMKGYNRYGGYSTASVRVTYHKIEIWFNTEKPYLGSKFFDLLSDVKDAIRSRLIESGYEAIPEEDYLFSMICLTFHRIQGDLS